jgi:hypothetical protein
VKPAAKTRFRPGKRFFRGHLAKLLGVDPSEIRWIPGVLKEVHTRFGTLYEFEWAFMTRIQAARRLHKCKSTIVAIEGTLLYPEIGPGDVRLFDVDDVEELAGKPLGEAAHSEWLKDRMSVHEEHPEPLTTTSLAPQANTNTKEVERLRRENEELRRMLLEHIEAWTEVRRTYRQREIRDVIDEMIAEHRAALGIDDE